MRIDAAALALAEHLAFIRAPGQGMAVAAVGGDDPIPFAQGEGEPYLGGLLADGEVGGAMHLLPFEKLIDALFETARTHHRR